MSEQEKQPKKKRRVLWTVLIIVCAAVFVVSAGVLLHYVLEYRAIDEENNQIVSTLDETPTQEQIDALPEGAQESAAVGYANNPDYVGAITLPNTGIHYAVVQATDNEKYLSTSFYGAYSRLGTVFVDYRCTISAEGMSDNTIVYGHNANNGSFFHNLTNYKSASYASGHSVVQFDTLYANNTYLVIGAFLADPNAAENDLFDYQNYISLKGNRFTEFWQQVSQRSYFTTSLPWDETDEYITLSTCDYTISDGRIVLVARKLRDGETASSAQGTYTDNANQRMPDSWYTKKGLDNPFL